MMRSLKMRVLMQWLVVLFVALIVASSQLLYSIGMLRQGIRENELDLETDLQQLVVSPLSAAKGESGFYDEQFNMERIPYMPNVCVRDEYTVWEDWKVCMEHHLDRQKWRNNEMKVVQPVANANKKTLHMQTAPVRFSAFDTSIIESRENMPWALDANFTAVMLEFRPWRRQLTFSVNNAMNNLPVHWRIQILGGPSILRLAEDLFPVEVAAGKIVLTDLGRDEASKALISEILTDWSFYEQLLGNVWLFFQYDSVICSQQRWRLRNFLEDSHGWWGAPWSHWDREPKIGGNGGFSLRKKDFIATILSRFNWNGWPEDWYICHKAADMYNELPDELKPAPADEAANFSAEMLFSEEPPFGTHQFWCCLSPDVPQMKSMIETCPETLGIMPPTLLSDSRWAKMVCSLNVSRISFDPAVNITFDFQTTCKDYE